jgi:hypothetical protein
MGNGSILMAILSFVMLNLFQHLTSGIEIKGRAPI